VNGALVWLVAAVMPTVPGAVNPDVTPDNIATTICVRGWTQQVRPPMSYTEKLKRQAVKRDLSKYEEDHLIPLELGGAPADPNNLWPQVYAGACGARAKDKVERRLNGLVCSGKLGLREAQEAIRSDWVKAYQQHVGPLECDQ
jgi:hypothetical protein